MFDLNQPLRVGPWLIDCVELPYPGEKRYPHEGWEHCVIWQDQRWQFNRHTGLLEQWWQGVKATLVRSGGEVTMVLSAEETGEQYAIEMRTDATGSPLETSLGDTKELSKAQYAIVYLGADASGMTLKRSV